MGMVVDGKWEIGGRRPDSTGRFIRVDTVFRDWITNDGSSDFPAERGRYHLYVSWACPWAHRTLIMRALKGLTDAISISVVDPRMDEMGWAFTGEGDATADHLLGKQYLHQVYIAARDDYTGRASVPVLWDKPTGRIVNNESREIMRMLDHAFAPPAGGGPTRDFCPPALREAVDGTIQALYQPVNNGVYRCGFARSQEAYDEAVEELFAALEHWEAVLGRQRYLCGEHPTEADICLFTTMIRFDLVYHYHFKCNWKRLADYPNLLNHTRDVYQWPGVAETCNFDHIKRHYYWSHDSVNPARIVPKGPGGLDYGLPHDRGRTFSA